MKRDPLGIFFSSPPSAMLGVFALITVAAIGITAAIAIPNLLSAVQRGRQKTTMESMRLIGVRMEQLKSPAGYPIFQSIDALNAIDSALPLQDGWGRPLKLISDAQEYFLVSAGKDGQFEQPDPRNYQPGIMFKFEDDIVYSNGRFVRKPEGAKE